MSRPFHATRTVARVALASALASAALAAGTQEGFEELDEVFVTVKTEIPLKDFVEFPRYDSVAISPEGTRLAIGWIDDNYRRQVVQLEYPSMKTIHNHALPSSHSAANVRWASERRLLVEVEWPRRGLLRVREPIGVLMTSDPNGGNPHTINAEALGTMEPLDLQRRDDEAVAAAAASIDPTAARLSGKASRGPVRLVSLRTGQPDQLLFQTVRANDRSGNTDGSGAYVLDLRNNRETQVATLPLPGGQFVTGPDYQVALVTGVNARNETVVYYLPPDVREHGTAWQLAVSSAGGERGLRPVAWTGNAEEYYALDGRNGPTRAVVIWDALTNTQRLLYRHPGADMDRVSLDSDGKAWMFSGTDHFPAYWYPDPQHPLARLHRALVQKAEGELIDIPSSSDDLSAAVVQVESGRRPPLYFGVDVVAVNSMSTLFSYPTLRRKHLSRVEPIEFRARDGLVIRGYLTTPEDGNGKPLVGLPLVVIAHEGPLGRPAGPGYEFERQLFASRGYAVLQVNHRGTAGRGVAYERAGDGKWGREVQDDFIDGVRWAIRDGVADAERICFYGIGYGAFSAMTAAARAPDLFKCAIGVGGVYDLPALLGNGQREIPAALRQVFGDDMEVLKQQSPVSMAGSIKASVLLMPQERDEFVPMDQSRSMRTALRDAGNAAQWELIGQEYNGQHSPESRAGAYVRILRFLEQRIGE